MVNKKARNNSAIYQYFFWSIVVISIYTVLSVSIIWFYPNILSVIICVAMYILLKILVSIIATMTLGSILFKKLDALEFRNVINDKHLLPPLTYRLTAALSAGDYQTVVNIATSQIGNKNLHIKKKYFYLCSLASVYFELRDFEKLKILVSKYEEYKANYPSKAFFYEQLSVWDYYKNFLGQKYEDCKIVCKERNLRLKPNAMGAKIGKLRNDFFYAIACYENGETDVAKEYFESIIFVAPKMYLANISKKYLEAIEQNCLTILSDIEILPDFNYKIYNEKTIAKIRYGKIIKTVLAIVFVVLLVISSSFNHKMKKSKFEVKLDAALEEEYGQITKIEIFSLKKDKKNVGSLCILDLDDDLILVEVGSNNEGQTFATFELARDIVFDAYYCSKSWLNDYYIGFEIATNKPLNDSFYYMLEFEFNGNTYWFYVDYIEDFPKS